MSSSTVWSLMSFSMALMSYAMHRDISANIFLATVFAIQGVKIKQELGARHADRIKLMVFILGCAISLYATWAIFTGVDLGKPANFGIRAK